MSQRTRHITLTAADVSYLIECSILPSGVQQKIEEGVSGHLVIELSEKIAEECRSAFSERLATVGFDRNYEPTSEGLRLEALIDKFA